MRSTLRLGLLSLALASAASAQGAPDTEPAGPGLRFNGLGRSYIQQSTLGGRLAAADTVTAETLADGNFVLDLAVNAQPFRTAEVQGTLRLRNEFGGFFGAGATVEVRELWARGVIADAVRYRVGDMDLALTPYTLFLPERDATVNTPELFEPQRGVIDYEQFYTAGNTRRLQGGTVDFGLDFDRGLDAVDARVFVARLRATDFLTVPTRLISGGRVGATSPTVGPFASQARVGANLSYLADDLQSGNANAGIRNSVYSVDADVTLLRRSAYTLSLVGEAGRSYADSRTRTEGADSTSTDSTAVLTTVDRLLDISDTFAEVGLAAAFPARGVTVSAMLVDVGPDFYSAAAQSKREDYTRSLGSYNRIGNDGAQRPVSLYDLTRDPGIYTFRIASAQMAYDPRYGNVLPYGKATPNRRGLRLGGTYAPLEGPVSGTLDVALLREIRGQGTPLLKRFARVRAGTDVAIGRLAGLSRAVGLTLGAQVERTSRGGNAFETVGLTTTLLETGLSAEVYDRLDLLLGGTFRTSSGRDYVPQIVDFNTIRDFPNVFVADDHESIVGAGLRYRFQDDIFLTVQYQSFAAGSDASPERDYRIGQVFALYSMTF